MSKFKTLKEKIVGPVYPICPCFDEKGSLDLAATADYVKYLISHNVRTVMVTAGTSRFSVLTDSEVMELNKTVALAANAKAVVIAANPMTGSTQAAVNFAKHAQDVGADALILYYPDRYYDDLGVIDYFGEVARQSDIALLVHGIPLRNARTVGPQPVPYGVQLCRSLCEIPNVIGMKEEHGNEGLRYYLAKECSDKMAFIVAGAGMRMFLASVLYGVQAYLVGVGSFDPQIEERFYDCIKNGDYPTALSIVHEKETPFFDVAMPMGWHTAMKATLHLLNLSSPYERSPLKAATITQQEELKKVIQNIGLTRGSL